MFIYIYIYIYLKVGIWPFGLVKDPSGEYMK